MTWGYNERRLPDVIRYLKDATGRYPDVIGAPGGFNGRHSWKIPIPPERKWVFSAAEDPRATSEPFRVHEVELREYVGSPGSWCYQNGDYASEFYPPVERP